MKINNNFFIAGVHNSSDIVTNIFGSKRTFTPYDSEYNALKRVLKTVRRRTIDTATKNNILRNILTNINSDPNWIESKLFNVTAATTAPATTDTAETTKPGIDKTVVTEILDALNNFLSEFGAPITIRMADTFFRVKDKKAYISNYFKLCNNNWTKEIDEKLKSAEFRDIASRAKAISLVKPKVNTRLKIYFGPQGTGKTTTAMNEAVACIPCSSDTSCKELLKDFDFDENGKPTFKKSVLWTAIEEGHKIVLDEINLLNKDTRQFLQELTDGKPYIDFEGTRIMIHPDFQVIGTMNLYINGVAFPLTEPMVDRCEVIEEFKLTTDKIANMLV